MHLKDLKVKVAFFRMQAQSSGLVSLFQPTIIYPHHSSWGKIASLLWFKRLSRLFPYNLETWETTDKKTVFGCSHTHKWSVFYEFFFLSCSEVKVVRPSLSPLSALNIHDFSNERKISGKEGERERKKERRATIFYEDIACYEMLDTWSSPTVTTTTASMQFLLPNEPFFAMRNAFSSSSSE